MGWISPIAFLLCHTYSIGDAATLETFSSKSVLSPERGALTGHFRKYLGFVCRGNPESNFSHLLSEGTFFAEKTVPARIFKRLRCAKKGVWPRFSDFFTASDAWGYVESTNGQASRHQSARYRDSAVAPACFHGSMDAISIDRTRWRNISIALADRGFTVRACAMLAST